MTTGPASGALSRRELRERRAAAAAEAAERAGHSEPAEPAERAEPAAPVVDRTPEDPAAARREQRARRARLAQIRRERLWGNYGSAWLRAVRMQPTDWFVVVLSAMIVMDGALPGVPLPVPPAQFAGAGLALLAALRLAGIARGMVGVMCGLAAVLGVVGVSATLAPDWNITRLGTITAWALLLYGVARGVLPIGSIARGAGLSIVVGVVYGFATLPRSDYVGRLTGYFGDPNTAGMILAVLGFALVPFLRRPSARLLLVLAVIAGVLGTFSRTSLFALAVGALLIVFGHRLHVLLVAAIVTVSVWWAWGAAAAGVGFLGSEWWFADREGSDALRNRLLPLEEAKRAAAGWFGHGPGEGMVTISEELTMFSHNSYYAFQMEFGVLGLMALGLLTLTLVVRYLDLRRTRHPLASWSLGALITVALCAVNLGEVILTFPAAIAAGTLVLVSRHVRPVSRTYTTVVEAPGSEPVQTAGPATAGRAG